MKFPGRDPVTILREIPGKHLGEIFGIVLKIIPGKNLESKEIRKDSFEEYQNASLRKTLEKSLKNSRQIRVICSRGIPGRIPGRIK